MRTGILSLTALLFIISSCLSPSYKVGDSYSLSEEQALHLHLPDGVQLLTSDGQSEKPASPGGEIIFVPGTHKLGVGLLEYNQLGTRENPNRLEIQFSGNAGESFFGCVHPENGGSWSLSFAKDLTECSDGFVEPGTGPSLGSDVEETLFHGKAAFQNPEELVKITFSSNTFPAAVANQDLLLTDYRTLYVLPGKIGVGVSYHESSGNSFSFSLGSQTVTIDGKPGSQFFICSRELPDQKWKPVVSKDAFACE